MRNEIKGMLCSMLAGTALLTSTSAWAADEDGRGFYIAAEAGVATLNDPVITYYDAGGTFGGTGAEDTATARLTTKSAVTFGGTIGYDFGPVRADVQIQYSRHKIPALTIQSVNGSTVTLDQEARDEVCDYLEADTCGGTGNTFNIPGSRVRQLSAMANLWLDLPVGDKIVPYVGGGAGIAGFEIDGEGKGKFAWQLGAGVAFKLSDKMALTADYRHREVGRTNEAYDASSGFRLSKLKTDALTAGVRFTF
ncbi:outer membrane protein [Novosphingobium taihuense]|uniref:Opacity protein-like surface antigen n=1 Tax=Novosphingobium taihuense TaxID=260085 RepID=A0A7W7AB85_9SPHN|nr:outer membrane beta-barrel protein [Novosphingobium taihuense]MBB4613065.1 opacity protein-like surface antigen [Novosphingobium taihuense]TWH85208.1 outer membrane protein with beta-barrel domain [Novosphingobium taihuense]